MLNINHRINFVNKFKHKIKNILYPEVYKYFFIIFSGGDRKYIFLVSVFSSVY